MSIKGSSQHDRTRSGEEIWSMAVHGDKLLLG